MERKFWHPTMTSQFKVCPIPFHMDTYRGCVYNCRYCLSGDTLILMADNSTKFLRDLCVGDEIYGVEKRGSRYYYVKTIVLKKWETQKTSYKITFENGESVICSEDHRWLSDRGWKYTLPKQIGQRPFLTVKNYIRGFNSTMVDSKKYSFTDDYKRGYLFGVIKGDGSVGSYDYSGKRENRKKDIHYRFRLAMEDKEAIQRAKDYLECFSIETDWFKFPAIDRQTKKKVYWDAIRTSKKENFDKIQELLVFKDNEEFYRGFLAGIYDAEGATDQLIKRMFNGNTLILSHMEKCLEFFKFKYKYDKTKNECKTIRLLGGISEFLRFAQVMSPAISKKFDFSGICLKNKGSKIKGIVLYKENDSLLDITTGTGNFIANGLVSHNCFARDFVMFARRNSEHKEFTYLVGNSPEGLKRWVDRVLKKDLNYDKSEEVAFKERVPVKIGATADPFPYVEKKERITYDILKVLKDIDYPTQISTKNPEVLLSYVDDLKDANMVVNVTITTINEKLCKVYEPGAISPERRFNAIEELVGKGVKTFVRIQPFIYHTLMKELEGFIERIAKSKCQGFQSEGLKLRVTMPREEQAIYKEMSDYIGVDLRKYYKEEGIVTGSDWELKPQVKEEVLYEMDRLAKKNKIQFYNADNHMKKDIGCGSECCGTSCLRNYKILACNKRTKLFNDSKNLTNHLQKCKVNFVRSQKYKDKTIEEVCDM